MQIYAGLFAKYMRFYLKPHYSSYRGIQQVDVVFGCNIVCHGGRFVPWMDGQSELVMVDGEDLFGLEVHDNLFEVFRHGVDIFPIGVVLTVFQ